MGKRPTDPAIDCASATLMRAIGMTRHPEIGKVADALVMLAVDVARPANGEVVIKIAASSIHIDEIFAAQGTAIVSCRGRGRYHGRMYCLGRDWFCQNQGG